MATSNKNLHRGLVMLSLFFISFMLVGQEVNSPQDKKLLISTRIGLNSVNQVNLQLELDDAKNGVVHILELGYNLGWHKPKDKRTGNLCDNENYKVALSKRGILFKYGIQSLDGSKWSYFLDLRYGWVNDMRLDTGCKDSSYNPSDINLYNWKGTDIGTMIYYDVKKNNSLSAYIGFGGGLRFIERDFTPNQYTVPVLIDNSDPDNPVYGPMVLEAEPSLSEDDVSFVFRFDLGLRINIWRKKSKKLNGN